LSVALYEEINTQNSINHYTSGNIFHADFTSAEVQRLGARRSGCLQFRAGDLVALGHPGSMGKCLQPQRGGFGRRGFFPDPEGKYSIRDVILPPHRV
jgi:hypothetical protein